MLQEILNEIGEDWVEQVDQIKMEQTYMSGGVEVAAEPLITKIGVGGAEPPAPDRPVGDVVAYHLRTGGHDITDYDWARYLEFADRHFSKR